MGRPTGWATTLEASGGAGGRVDWLEATTIALEASGGAGGRADR
jgi:hypothetical protein